MIQVFQVALAALIITTSAWLSKKYPQWAGLLIALPISSMLVLPFAYWQHGDGEASVKFAQEILKAIPVSITFFIPFALAERFSLSFPQAYGVGTALLVGSFFLSRAIMGPSG